MYIDLSSLLLASLICASGYAPIRLLRLHSPASEITQVFVIAGLVFVLLIACEYNPGPKRTYHFLPAEASDGF